MVCTSLLMGGHVLLSLFLLAALWLMLLLSVFLLNQ